MCRQHRIIIRFSRVLTTVYNTRDCWVFGLSPSSSVYKEYNVPETGYVPVLI
jgi:hypothetical protein